MQSIRGCCAAFFKYARKNRYCELVVDDIDIPWDAPKIEKNVLQPDEIRTLLTVNTRESRGKLVEDYYVNAYRWQLDRAADAIANSFNSIANFQN